MKTIKMEVLEQDEQPCPEGQKKNPETNECEPIEPKEYSSAATPDTEDQDISHADRQGTRSLTGTMIDRQSEVALGISPGSDSSKLVGKIPVGGETVPKAEQSSTEQPTAGEQPPVTGTDKIDPMPVAGEQPSVTGDAPEEEPAPHPVAPEKETPPEAHTCPDGYHYDPNATPPCVPNELTTEKVARFKAEDKARTFEERALMWEKRYVDLDRNYNKTLGTVAEQKETIKGTRDERDKFHAQFTEGEIRLRQLKNDLVDLQEDKKKLEKQVENVSGNNDEVTKKYQNTLAINLELSKKLTKANEDYLDVASRCERLEAEINKAKSISKKILKIRV